jgi:hypothetical protein
MWKSLWCRWNHRATHRVNAVVPARQQHCMYIRIVLSFGTICLRERMFFFRKRGLRPGSIKETTTRSSTSLTVSHRSRLPRTPHTQVPLPLSGPKHQPHKFFASYMLDFAASTHISLLAKLLYIGGNYYIKLLAGIAHSASSAPLILRSFSLSRSQ